jgi:Lipase (class 3)
MSTNIILSSTASQSGSNIRRRHGRTKMSLFMMMMTWCLFVSWQCSQVSLLNCEAGRPMALEHYLPYRRNGRAMLIQSDTSSSLVARITVRWSCWMEWWRKKEIATNLLIGNDDKDQTEGTATATKTTTPSKAKKNKQRAKTGRQKIQSCRHLASSGSRHSASSRLNRLWRRGKNVVKRQRGRWRRLFHGNVNNEADEASINDSTTQMPTSSRDMNLAYSMAAMASLSYWPFHKKPLPENRLSFELMTLKNGTPEPLRRKRRKRKRDRALGMALKGVAAALKQTSPWLPKSRRNRQNRGSYRESWQSSIQDRLLKSEQRRQEQNATDGRIHLEYFLYNWYEPTPLGVKYHDTDLLVATSNHGETLILAFAGTDSVPDTVTNLQTFESVQHMGGLFQTATLNSTTTAVATNITKLEGSIHRGFLNAYSRTERGSILNLCDDSFADCISALSRDSILHRRYSHCSAESTANVEADSIPAGKDFDQYDVLEAERQTTETLRHSNTTEPAGTTKKKEESVVKKRGRRGCKVKNKRLMDILRDLVTNHLKKGRSVLLTGHSLGGSLATILALDILIHFPQVPVDKLQLWTFGGAQVTDNKFLESALSLVPRLQNFLEQDPRREWARVAYPMFKARSQFHRFVSKYLKQLRWVSTNAVRRLSYRLLFLGVNFSCLR